jgi:hypothetical protein
MEDPCWKVLPAALKKYKINDDWKMYALFICYGNTGESSFRGGELTRREMSQLRREAAAAVPKAEGGWATARVHAAAYRECAPDQHAN